jgi:hypothetical protein
LKALLKLAERLASSERTEAVVAAELTLVGPQHIYKAICIEDFGLRQRILRALIMEVGQQIVAKGSLLASFGDQQVKGDFPSQAETSPPSINDEIPMASGDFTEAANFALLFARLEAATFDLPGGKIDPRCLLVGLVMEQVGMAGRVLRRHGVSLLSLRKISGDTPQKKLKPADLERLVFDGPARRILSQARKTSRMQGHRQVHSIDLLWAILTAGKTNARAMLASLVGDLADVQSEAKAYMMTLRHEGYSLQLGLNAQMFNSLVPGKTVMDDLHRGLPDLSRLDKLPLVGGPHRSSGTAGGEAVRVFGVDCDLSLVAVLNAATRAAALVGAESVSGDFLLLGLAEVASPAATLMASIGLDCESIRETLAAHTGRGELLAGEKLTLSRDLGNVFRAALAYAGSSRGSYRRQKFASYVRA